MALWPVSPFAVPVSSFVSPVPVPGVDPLAGDCVIFRFNKAWLPYITGALQQLILQTTWQGDPATVQEAQAQAMNLILALADVQPGGCGPDEVIPPITESEYEMSLCEQLRFNGGRLEALCCGVWTPIEGQTGAGLPPTAGQPGAGSGLPAPNGGQNEYCGTLGRGTWLIPAPLNSGDTLLFSDLFGAWQDNRDLFWHCPDGFLFVLDVCGPTLPHGSPDPLPTGYHMQIIININGTYYDCLLTDSQGNLNIFTVPGGVSNATAFLQANIDDTDLINGTVQFCVNVTNNVVGTWQHKFNFINLPGGWIPCGNGEWTPSVGFTDTLVMAGPNSYRGANLCITFPNPLSLTRIQVETDASLGSNPQNVAILTQPGSSVVLNTANVNGTNIFDTGVISASGVTGIEIDDSVGECSGSCDPGGTLAVLSVTLSGLGADPFI